MSEMSAITQIAGALSKAFRFVQTNRGVARCGFFAPRTPLARHGKQRFAKAKL
jgi:hypothetical protein